MKDLLNPQGGLRALLWETKFIYTVFVLFNFAAYAVMGLMMAGKTGFTPPAIAEYYRGNEDNPDAAVLRYPRGYTELLETTHFHVYAIPLMLFVQGHIFLLCGWPRNVKVALVLLAFAGAALQIFAPWLVVYASPGMAWLVLAGRALLGGCLLLFGIVPLIEMWRVPNHRALAR